MADLEENLGTSSLFTSYGHNIPMPLDIKNYSIWIIYMCFSLDGLKALPLIEADLPLSIKDNFFAVNVKFTGQALSLITSKIGNATMDLGNRAKTVKKLWSYLYLQYYKKK